MRKLLTLAVVTTAIAAFAVTGTAGAATGNYGGSANVNLVHVNALNVPGSIDLADAKVSPALAEVASSGLAGKPTRSHAHATNLDVNLLSGAIPVQALVTADQTAPPDNAKANVSGPVIPVPAAPLLDATVSTATAHARWPGDDACVAAGQPISEGRVDLATAKVLTGVPASGQSLLALENKQGQTVYTDSTVGLVNVAGQTTKGVQSQSITQVTAITLFQGGSNAITINVLAPPTVTAVASGTPGGAHVTYNEPVLQVVDATGKVLGELSASSINTTINASPLVTISVGKLTKTEAADGTSASGSADLVDIKVLNIGVGGAALDLSVAAGSVSATAPSGGVNCPDNSTALREVHKDASAGDVAPGGTFQYDLAVPNRGTCTLTSVKVVDTITGPAGSKVSATVPPASNTNGLVLTWDDIGPLAPNDTKTLQVTVSVPSDAPLGAVYNDHLVVSAICDGAPLSHPVDLSGPTVSSGSGPCDLSASNVRASHLQVVPGETFQYYVHVFNQGATTCDGVNVSDTLPPGTTFVSCSDSCTNSGQNVSWSLGPLAGGSSRDLFVTVKVDANAKAGTHLPDTAVLSAANGAKVNVSTPGPVVSGESVLAPPDPPRRTKVSGQLASTGGVARTPLWLGMILAGLALLGLRRRALRADRPQSS